MKIGIIFRKYRASDYDEISGRRSKSWYKGVVSRHTIEYATYKYVKRRYPEHKFFLVDPYKLGSVAYRKRVSKFDVVWLGFEDSTNVYKQVVVERGINKRNIKRAKVVWNNVMKLKNIFPKAQFVDFMSDKCKYYTFLDKKGFSIMPTKCWGIKQLKNLGGLMRFIRRFKKVYIKPIPSGEGYGNISFTKNTPKEEVEKYVRDLESKGMEKIVVQEFSSFATPGNPELRTYWVGGKYVYGVRTYYTGYFKNRIMRLPAKLNTMGTQIHKELTKKFKMPILSMRIDYGKQGKNYFVNELEIMYGTFLDYIGNQKIVYEKRLGDELMRILQKKTNIAIN